MGLGTSWEQSHNGSVNGHGLIRLILDSKRMCHADPSIKEAFVQHNSFLEILPSNLKLLTMEIISSNREPTDRMCGVTFYQIMSTVVKIPSES